MAVRIYGNRQIKTLAGDHTRPTASRVREALFNIWQGNICDCQWLDLCSGSGAMGAEALCRGASRIVGIENDAKACAIIRHNWEKVASNQQSFNLIRGNVLQKLERLGGQSFDLIYFDPPYSSGLYEPVLNAIAAHHILNDNGELAVEHRTDRALPNIINDPASTSSSLTMNQVRGSGNLRPLKCCRRKTYGGTSLTFYSPTGLGSDIG